MKNKLSRIGMTLLAVLFAPALLAANLQGLDVSALPGDKVELKLVFDEVITAPRGYTIEQPARIAVDLPGVKNQLGVKKRELGAGNARSVSIVETQDRTRLIINMTHLAPYSTRVEGKNLYIVVGEGVQASAPIANTPVVKPYVAKQSGISNIDFQRGEQGAGDVIIELNDPTSTPDIQDQGGKIRVTFAKSSLPEALRVRLDVKDFATPVQFITASETNGKVAIVIEPTGFYDYLAYQADNTLTVSVKPFTQEQIEKRQAERFAYTGEKLSLNFQDIDVRSVLQLIADFTDLNLVASDTVQGNITLRLQNVPWDQALDLVLKTKGLDQRKIGNVLLVAPADEIAARERQEMESQKQIAELAPLRRELIQVNYAKAAQIAALFQSVTSDQGEVRGSITVDDRTNSIIAYQTQDKLDELRRVVAQLDIPVRQVMIEARIVEANVDYSKSLGVSWDGTLSRSSGRWKASGASAGAGTPFVDLGASGATAGLGIGFVSNHAILDLELSAMEKTGNGEVVSQPKVVTSDKETAKILKGAEIPYQEASSSGATSTSFKEASLSLEVTPQITPDNRIIMDVKVTKDEADFANELNGVPPIKKNEVNANVLVSDGETIVIGGVFSNTQTRAVDKVPFLGDVPFLGRLFRRDTVTDQKSELLVFITPRIMNNQAISLNY
ncbi:MAG TPA: type IV pilus secretin PilQ family protein [Thiopseudomonas sp.]|nr:type IV pilus secretin PilQ family protein [Thiopseudomonas sp.]